MRKYALIAAAFLLVTNAHAEEVRGLVVTPPAEANAPVILSAEQLARQQAQQPAAPGQAAPQQPLATNQAVNGTTVPPAAPQQPQQQVQLTPEQQSAQQQAARQQQIAQQRQMAAQQRQMAQQQRMQQQRMMQQQMARNMTPEQKIAYKVHEVKTKIKMTLVNAILR